MFTAAARRTATRGPREQLGVCGRGGDETSARGVTLGSAEPPSQQTRTRTGPVPSVGTSVSAARRRLGLPPGHRTPVSINELVSFGTHGTGDRV